jgi:thioredoxin reductase
VVAIAEREVELRVGAETVRLPNDYVFVFAGGDPPFAFLKKIGVRFGGASAADAPSPRAGA